MQKAKPLVQQMSGAKHKTGLIQSSHHGAVCFTPKPPDWPRNQVLLTGDNEPSFEDIKIQVWIKCPAAVPLGYGRE